MAIDVSIKEKHPEFVQDLTRSLKLLLVIILYQAGNKAAEPDEICEV